MPEWTWIFERAGRRVAIVRRAANEAFVLKVTDGEERPRRYRFNDARALSRFQTDMETFLLRTGWAFTSFSPERRRGRDRRRFPRIEERRRWWTDGSLSVLDAASSR